MLEHDLKAAMTAETASLVVAPDLAERVERRTRRRRWRTRLAALLVPFLAAAGWWLVPQTVGTGSRPRPDRRRRGDRRPPTRRDPRPRLRLPPLLRRLLRRRRPVLRPGRRRWDPLRRPAPAPSTSPSTGGRASPRAPPSTRGSKRDPRMSGSPRRSQVRRATWRTAGAS